ncbi:MAG: hypothetical protein K2G53_09040 [Muribaculaceae bacterium]|nr:hypothetical protein [Muribaculaceae bacterium]
MNKPQPTSQISVSAEVIEPLYNRASVIIEDARNRAYHQVNESLIRHNWELGKMIAEEELNGEDRAKYGASVIKELSKRLTATYGKGFTKTNIYGYVKFYEMFPEIFHAVSGKSIQFLSWTHYRILVQELNDDARRWYESEAASQNWSVRTLQRNVV